MKRRSNNFLGILLAVVLVVIAVIWFLGDDLEHIEDTNGPDDYTLTTITDQQIIDRSTGCLNVKTKTGLLSDMVEFSSDKFTGVYEIMYNNYIGSVDVLLNLYDFTVTSGNFKMCVVNEEEIVAVLEPDDMVEYLLEDVSGTVRLVIAGESAEFSFKINESDYDTFTHD